MKRIYVSPQTRVIKIALAESINLGVGSTQASEDEQLSKRGFFDKEDYDNTTSDGVDNSKHNWD